MDDSGDSDAEPARRARSRLIGINHVALEVGDLDAALELYGRLFELELRGRSPGMAFISATISSRSRRAGPRSPIAIAT